MLPRPNDVPLLCSYPCPALCPLPKPGSPSADSLVPTQLCLLPPGLWVRSAFCDLSPGWDPSPLSGLHDLNPDCEPSAQLYSSPAQLSDTPTHRMPRA